MTYLTVSDETFGFFDAEAMAYKGADLHEAYVAGEPFPHIVIDEFCSPDILRRCLDYFPEAPDPDSQSFNRDQERYKTSFNPDYLPGELRSFFYSMNSRPFIRFIENMTGIKGLIPDPYFLGGGFHQTSEGGHLSVHADFNLHKPMGLERRLNLLIYLNDDWQEEYGGALELWDRDMKTQVHKIVPVFNRCVVFSTSGESFHGHPEPVAHPEHKPRRSIALYYYTATWDETASGRTTQFKRRPKSDDSVDWNVKLREAAEDLTPPLLLRNIKRVTRRLGR